MSTGKKGEIVAVAVVVVAAAGGGVGRGGDISSD
jgi:hypothetical protein